MRIRLAIATAVALLVIFPAALFAQSEAARQLIDLVFSEDKSSVVLDDEIQSTALLRFTHDGKDYQVEVPVTISLDETVPLAESTSVTDNLSRAGVYAVEIIRVLERSEEIKIGYSTYEPSDEDHKLVFVVFELTNLSNSAKDFGGWGDETVIGIDAVGRRFEMEKLFDCEEVNPSSVERCAAMFNVRDSVTLTKVAIVALDENTLALPEAVEWVIEEEDD